MPGQVSQRWRYERDDIAETTQQLGRDLSASEKKRLRLLRSERIQRYLDASHGACWMHDERIASIVVHALWHFDGERYDLAAWCVMPNHVHVLVRPCEGYRLPDIVHSWKSFAARKANQVLGGKGTFWCSEYHDHLVRDKTDFDRILEYILKNPEKAGLKNWKWLSG